MEKLELAAVNMLKLAEEVDEDNPLLKSRLRQEGVQVLAATIRSSANSSSACWKQTIDLDLLHFDTLPSQSPENRVFRPEGKVNEKE